jgi:hypothetical protein
MRNVEYREYRIEPQSYLSDGGRWRAKAIVVVNDSASVSTVPVFGQLDRTFATEEQADAWAVEIAKTWINERG